MNYSIVKLLSPRTGFLFFQCPYIAFIDWLTDSFIYSFALLTFWAYVCLYIMLDQDTNMRINKTYSPFGSAAPRSVMAEPNCIPWCPHKGCGLWKDNFSLKLMTEISSHDLYKHFGNDLCFLLNSFWDNVCKSSKKLLTS